jgi:phage-related protein
MDRRIFTYGGYFERFMKELTQKEQQKIKYGLLLLKSQEKISTRFVKYIRDGIYELRTLYNGNIFRVFFIFDDGNIVVLFNGFQKKTQKTPESEIELAIKIKVSYYADKRPSD